MQEGHEAGAQNNFEMEHIWEKLRGARILVAGPDSEEKRMFLQHLQVIGRLPGMKFESSEEFDRLQMEDYVIIFCTKDPQPAPEKVIGYYESMGRDTGKQAGTGMDGWQEFFAVTKILQKVARVKPKAALLLSDSRIYGKYYGDQHLLREDEIGYLCHTSEKDQPAQCLRTLEHLGSRMAREDGVALKVARIQRGGAKAVVSERLSGPGIAGNSSNPTGDRTGERVEQMIEAALHVLLNGTFGEAYNIPGKEELPPSERKTSSLSPNLIITDTGKAGRLE